MIKAFFNLICALFLLGAFFAVYYSGLHGSFVFDDVANITSNSHVQIHDLNIDTLLKASSSGASGPLKRPISMVTFAVNYYLTGFNPFYFKLTNLLIHLLNGIGIFVLARLLLGFYREKFRPQLPAGKISLIALAVSVAWLLHPLNLTSVLYVVQRMTSLSAFFTIWGLILFVWGRVRLCKGNNGIYLILSSLFIFTPFAALSKENGLLLPLLMFVTEISFFSFRTHTVTASRFLKGYYALTVLLPIALIMIYLTIHPEWVMGGYPNRDFTLTERLMTEARVVFFYLRQIMLPDTTQMGLYLDDIAISQSIFQPLNTVFAVLGVFALGGLAIICRTRAPLITFAVLFFFAGHILESTVLSLDIAYEHRNYLPMFGVLLAMFFYLLNPAAGIGYLRMRQVMAFLLIALFAFGTFSRANAWANPIDQFESEYKHHPLSVRNNIELGHLYSNTRDSDVTIDEDYLSRATNFYRNAVKLDKSDTGGLIGLIQLYAVRAKPMEPNWVSELAYRLEHVRYAPNTSDKLIDLTNCKLGGECVLSDSDMETLLSAALHNQKLSGGDRSKLLFAMSSYLINIKRDYPAALETMRKMIESSPNEMVPRLALTNFLIALQRIEDAKVEIRKMRVLDQQGFSSEEIDKTERLIAEIHVNSEVSR